MEIILNGQKKILDKKMSLIELIHQLGLDEKWVVAELNGEALIKKDYVQTFLSAGDHIELVRAVSGG
ncbi:MAG: sulfur carrier protein ThiS [Chlamydiae bacterium]|nr:sulfur carrier protein ThiS [Chlamydiota bacterium]MBI3276678.1 sulfur carrier protein ThiS [Chlamydiota bacterium]